MKEILKRVAITVFIIVGIVVGIWILTIAMAWVLELSYYVLKPFMPF